MGLNIRDSAMEKIFDVDHRQDAAGCGGGGGSGGAEDGGANAHGGQQHRGEEEKGFKFWVNVDIFRVDDK